MFASYDKGACPYSLKHSAREDWRPPSKSERDGPRIIQYHLSERLGLSI